MVPTEVLDKVANVLMGISHHLPDPISNKVEKVYSRVDEEVNLRLLERELRATGSVIVTKPAAHELKARDPRLQSNPHGAIDLLEVFKGPKR